MRLNNDNPRVFSTTDLTIRGDSDEGIDPSIAQREYMKPHAPKLDRALSQMIFDDADARIPNDAIHQVFKSAKRKKNTLKPADFAGQSIDQVCNGEALYFEHELKRGRWGMVYRGRWGYFPVAITLLQTPSTPQHEDDVGLDNELQRWGVLSTALKHNVVQLWCAHKFHNVMVIVTEYCTSTLEDAGPFASEVLANKIVPEIREGIEQIHALGFAHFHIRPADDPVF